MVDLTPHWERLERDLAALAHLGGPEVEAAFGRLLPAAEAPIRLRLVEALAQSAEEINALLPALRIQTRVTGERLEFAVEAEDAATEVTGDLDARITLRLPEELKFRIEAAADRDGLSLNAWLVRVLARSTTHALATLTPPLPPATPSVGRQLRGRGRA